ncbi:MAG: hypothetical protein HY347_03455 [candidate division NC10 bacterium]|nr:hypothetical protein [candidate division NC10 bacterium]
MSIVETKAIQVPEGWHQVAGVIARERGIVLLLGASDAGKTTFARYLIEEWNREGILVALVDGDIGQSTLGPPTTIGLALFPPASIGAFPPPPVALRFVGATSPLGHFLPLIVGLKRLADQAAEEKAGIVLVDTTGLIHGRAGRELKFQKIDLLRPQHLIALERQEELEPLLLLHEGRRGLKVHRLPVAEAVGNKPWEGRRAHRERKFQEYFHGAHSLELSLKKVRLHGFWFQGGRRLHTNELAFIEKTLGTIVLHGEQGPEGLELLVSGGITSGEHSRIKDVFGVSEVRIADMENLTGLLLGLNDAENDTLALGILQGLDLKLGTLSCLTPLQDPKAVRLIQFGSLRIDPIGRELWIVSLQKPLDKTLFPS